MNTKGKMKIFPFFIVSNMKIKVEDLIGLEVKDVRYIYTHDNGFGLQEFTTFIKLSNNFVFNLPYFIDEVMNIDEHDTTDNYSNAKHFSNDFLSKLIGKKLVDFHFVFINDELLEQGKAIVEFENNIYLLEKASGPIGLTDVDVKILSKANFYRLKEEIECEEGMKLMSLKKIIEK